MKRTRLFSALACLCALCILTLGVSAGWAEASDGKTYYYDKDGSKVTANREIDGVLYKFDADGVLQGKYTGWVTAYDNRYYYRDGVRHTGWLDKGGKRYYLNPNGIMRTGTVPVDQLGGNIFTFGPDGVWDGNEGRFSGYRPETLGDFLLDCPLLPGDKYDAKIGMTGKWSEFAGADVVAEILAADWDTKLVYGTSPSYDETEPPVGIYQGRDDIMIRHLDENGKPVANRAAYFFSKDKQGSSYFYCQYYNFGIQLKHKDSYDLVAESIKK